MQRGIRHNPKHAPQTQVCKDCSAPSPPLMSPLVVTGMSGWKNGDATGKQVRIGLTSPTDKSVGFLESPPRLPASQRRAYPNQSSGRSYSRSTGLHREPLGVRNIACDVTDSTLVFDRKKSHTHKVLPITGLCDRTPYLVKEQVLI